MRIAAALLCVVAGCGADAAGQQPAAGAADVREQGPFVASLPVTCESFAALIDHALVEWQDASDTFVIFIARPGAGERAGRLARSRLRDVDEYLTQRNAGGRLNYVNAEGGRVGGLGRIEIYVGGKLRFVIPVRKNAERVCTGKVNPFL